METLIFYSFLVCEITTAFFVELKMWQREMCKQFVRHKLKIEQRASQRDQTKQRVMVQTVLIVAFSLYADGTNIFISRSNYGK